MKLTIGFSPCPNDTFIFDALVNNKINTGDLEFDVIMEDVQTLNEMAIRGESRHYQDQLWKPAINTE
jgi:1,4-dihydroxy-6-naphthoate synthase